MTTSAWDNFKNVPDFCWMNLIFCTTKSTWPHGGFRAFHYLAACTSKTSSCLYIIWTWTVIIKANQNSKWVRYIDQDNYEIVNKQQLKILIPFRDLSNSYQNISQCVRWFKQNGITASVCEGLIQITTAQALPSFLLWQQVYLVVSFGCKGKELFLPSDSLRSIFTSESTKAN